MTHGIQVIIQHQSKDSPGPSWIDSFTEPYTLYGCHDADVRRRLVHLARDTPSLVFRAKIVDPGSLGTRRYITDYDKPEIAPTSEGTPTVGLSIDASDNPIVVTEFIILLVDLINDHTIHTAKIVAP